MYSRFELRRLALAGLFILTFTFGIRMIAPGPQPAPDFDGTSKGVEVVLDIPNGATGSQVGELLFNKGVIASSLSFFRVAVADSRSERIAPGEHRLDTRISAREALDQLLDPNRIVNLIRIRDGARLTEIQESLIEAGFSEVEIEAGFKSVKVKPPFSAKKLEGLLYPAFYPKSSKDNAASIIQYMADRFQASTKEINWSFGKFTPEQLLTIASLVESEGIPQDFAKVARVVYNRLEMGMPLQFDSTIHYIFDRRGELPLSTKDTKKSSPYNTFMNRGLPPGPIGSPTIAAIEATLNPADGPWLYFVTVLPKQTKFTADYKEFLDFKAEYKRNFASGEFE
jgi:UPF0755 protein